MTTFLVIVAVIAELVIIAFALVGLKTVRQQIRERDTGYRGHRNFGIPSQPAPPPTPAALPVPVAPTPVGSTGIGSGRNSSPAFASQSQRALPAPSIERKRPSRRLPSYIRLAVDNGPVPERRSRIGFKGNLRSVPR